MRLNEIRKGLRVWITNPMKVPVGYLPYGTVIRMFDHLGEHAILNIGVLLDQEGHVDTVLILRLQWPIWSQMAGRI